MKMIIVTPTRNEGAYIEKTLVSMSQQTIKPYLWVIVDDGSTDNTKEVIGKYSDSMPFIRCITGEDRGFRAPATGVIHAFYRGYDTVKNEDYDIIAKFDADLTFPPDTLEQIVKAFEDDPKLGITGGARYDYHPGRDRFVKVIVPPNFVGGPTKFYRRACFKDINGLINRAGWDGVDTVRANMKGWRTRELQSLTIHHLKPTGSADGRGLKKANLKYGDVSYYMGGHFWYFILRVIGRSVENRNITTGIYMLQGYLNALFKKEPREDKAFRTFLKKQQRENMKFWLTNRIRNK